MAWNLTASPSPKLSKMSNKNAGDQVLGMVSPSNRGFRSAADGGSPASSGGSPKRQYYSAFDQQEEAAEEDATDEILQQAEKKRRLTPEQVKFLEMSFEMENKLEPERKAVIAKELGLQPRQVAVWFQNRRARWKTKQLERAYDALKADYNAILKENEQLTAEVCRLTEKLQGCYEERKGDGVVKEEAMEAAEEVIAGLSRQQGGGEEAISSKEETELGSPTKSEQSEVLDSGNYSPPPPPPHAPPSTTATLVLPAATTTLVLPVAEIKAESNAVAAAAAAAFSSSSSLAHLLVMEDSVIAACEELFGDACNPLLFQQVAVKLEPGGGGGALFAADDYCNLVLWDEHSIFPWCD